MGNNDWKKPFRAGNTKIVPIVGWSLLILGLPLALLDEYKNYLHQPAAYWYREMENWMIPLLGLTLILGYHFFSSKWLLISMVNAGTAYVLTMLVLNKMTEPPLIHYPLPPDANTR